MSAWLFLVFINDLMNELKMSGYGITMAHIKIPGLLLADDTILLSTMAKGMQILIDILTSYATRWRLKYNPNKSCAILFTNKRNRIIENHLVMGQNKIPNVEETKYAGVLFTNNSSCQSRINNACEKATKTVNSLYTTGLHMNGLNPIASVKIGKHVILPSSFYGCELFFDISDCNINKMERVQRMFARRAQGLDQRSPSVSTTVTLGLMPLQTYIDKCKLLLLGRLCRQQTNHITKQIFLWKLGQYLIGINIGKCFVSDIMNVVKKYNLLDVIYSYLQHSEFMDKLHWCAMVKNTLTEFENVSHTSKFHGVPELIRYCDIHPNISVHILWKIAYVHPNFKIMLSSIIKIGSMKQFRRQCNLCNKQTLDFTTHILLHCEQLTTERNSAFELLANFMTIEHYVRLCDQSDERLLNCILGGENNDMNDLDFHDWIAFILSIIKIYTQVSTIHKTRFFKQLSSVNIYLC